MIAISFRFEEPQLSALKTLKKMAQLSSAIYNSVSNTLELENKQMKLMLLLNAVLFFALNSSAAEQVIVRGLLVKGHGGQFRGDIVAQVQQEPGKIHFSALFLRTAFGQSYRLTSENYVSAQDTLSVEEFICAKAAPASYKYSRSYPLTHKSIQVENVVILKDGSALIDPKAQAGPYEIRSGVTCSQTYLDHVGE